MVLSNFIKQKLVDLSSLKHVVGLTRYYQATNTQQKNKPPARSARFQVGLLWFACADHCTVHSLLCDVIWHTITAGHTGWFDSAVIPNWNVHHFNKFEWLLSADCVHENNSHCVWVIMKLWVTLSYIWISCRIFKWIYRNLEWNLDNQRCFSHNL